MKVLLYYWEPAEYEVSGHTAMTMIHVDGIKQFVSFWPILLDKIKGAASVYERDVYLTWLSAWLLSHTTKN